MADSLKQIIEDDLKIISKVLTENLNGLRTVTFNTIKGEMSRRIFQQGVATDGSPIGTYEPSTARARALGGRQTAKVDLEMTGVLRRSLIVGTEGKNVAMGLIDNKEPKISIEKGRVRIKGTSDFSTVDNAIKQEQNFGKEIFAPTDKELQTSEAVFLKEADKVIAKTLGNKKFKIAVKD